MSPGFYARSFSVFYDLLFKVPGQKTHWFWYQQAKDSSCVFTTPAFISQFIHPMCLIQGIFSATVYFGFICILRVHPPFPSSAPVVSDCPLLLTPDCNHCELQWSEHGKMFLSTKGPWSRWTGLYTGIGLLAHRMELSEQACSPTP